MAAVGRPWPAPPAELAAFTFGGTALCPGWAMCADDPWLAAFEQWLKDLERFRADLEAVCRPEAP